MLKANADYIFEVSWEVCNKVGGIYTVVASKANVMLDHYKNYFTIGPYVESNAELNFTEEKNIPGFLKRPISELKKQGITCHFGKWFTPKGEPNAILLEFSSLMEKRNDIKYKLWEKFKVDSYNAHWTFDEPVVWSTAVGMLLEKISQELKGKKIVSHFHEWLCGGALLYLKSVNSSIKTVFTTHATMLGRSLAGSGTDLYSLLDTLNPDQEAYKLGVAEKHLMEKACAHNAEVFTTVSEITGLEAEKILGKKPDVLVLNGLDIERFPTIEETSVKHVTCREKIREFLTFYFFPYYDFPLEHNLIYFYSGRNEFRNKGIDIFIKALGRLNQQLKKDGTQRTIAVFFWIPDLPHNGLRTELLENKAHFQHIKNFVEWNSKEIKKQLIQDFILKKDLTKEGESIFNQNFLREAKKHIVTFRRHGNPPLSTHYIPDEYNNFFMNRLKQEGLLNRKEDPVKIIVYPVYLTGNDELVNLPYMDATAGTHIGVYPSYYEPWGYTPLESAAMGVASITTDLAGFGKFIKPQLPQENPGIFVLERYRKSEGEIVENFFKIIYKYSLLSHAERVQNKLSAKNLARLADWSILIKNYIKAHNLALER